MRNFVSPPLIPHSELKIKKKTIPPPQAVPLPLHKGGKEEKDYICR